MDLIKGVGGDGKKNFYFFFRSCPYFIDISFHVTQSTVAGTTQIEREILMLFYIFFF